MAPVEMCADQLLEQYAHAYLEVTSQLESY